MLVDHIVDKIPLSKYPQLLLYNWNISVRNSLLQYYLKNQNTVNREYLMLCDTNSLFTGRYGLKQILCDFNLTKLYFSIEYRSTSCGITSCSFCGETLCFGWVETKEDQIRLPSWFWFILKEKITFCIDEQITFYIEDRVIYVIENPGYGFHNEGTVYVNPFQIPFNGDKQKLEISWLSVLVDTSRLECPDTVL